MYFTFSLIAIVILSAIFTNRFLNQLGIPTLFFFLFLGLFFGADGIFKVDFSNYELTKELASLALGFIIFFGGFCTKWKLAKNIFPQAVVLSTLGVLFTAFIVGIFCNFVLKFPILEGFLFGALICSTDAASVFSILKSKKIFLKEHTVPLLELESSSNDPMSYVLVVLFLGLMQGQSVEFVFILFIKQILFGILTGIIVAKCALYVFQRTKIITDGNDSLFVISIILITYLLPQIYNGNPFLAVYFLGICLGNAQIENKPLMMAFFDNLTKLAQIGIFFTLGLLASPRIVYEIFPIGFFMFLFLTFIARPIVIFILLHFFKSSIGQKVVVSISGLRGVASIVFAIIATNSNINLEYDLFHLIFLISVLSIAIQGLLLPIVAKRIKMIDDSVDIKKTFNDYQEECAIKFIRITVPRKHDWINKKISDINIPNGSVILYIKRNGYKILPTKSTRIKEFDRITLTTPIEYL